MSGPITVSGSCGLPTFSPRALNESFDEAIIERSVDIDAVGAHADLALMQESSDDRTRNGPIQISIVEHDAGRVAAELQCDALQCLCPLPPIHRYAVRPVSIP
jgi:hypothetical protein